jgi:hypothetical protein
MRLKKYTLYHSQFNISQYLSIRCHDQLINFLRDRIFSWKLLYWFVVINYYVQCLKNVLPVINQGLNIRLNFC